MKKIVLAISMAAFALITGSVMAQTPKGASDSQSAKARPRRPPRKKRPLRRLRARKKALPLRRPAQSPTPRPRPPRPKPPPRKKKPPPRASARPMPRPCPRWAPAPRKKPARNKSKNSRMTAAGPPDLPTGKKSGPCGARLHWGYRLRRCRARANPQPGQRQGQCRGQQQRRVAQVVEGVARQGDADRLADEQAKREQRHRGAAHRGHHLRGVGLQRVVVQVGAEAHQQRDRSGQGPQRRDPPGQEAGAHQQAAHQDHAALAEAAHSRRAVTAYNSPPTA